MKKLFIYGTLKKDCKYHKYYFTDKSKFIEKDAIKGSLYTFNASNGKPWFPILILDDKHVINGEVWEADEREYQSIRMMELSAGYIKATVITKNGHTCTVFVTTNEESRFKNTIQEKNRIEEWIER